MEGAEGRWSTNMLKRKTFVNAYYLTLGMEKEDVRKLRGEAIEKVVAEVTAWQDRSLDCEIVSLQESHFYNLLTRDEQWFQVTIWYEENM